MHPQTIQKRIYEIRGQNVMFDFDMAELYEVQTRVLNQAVRRNIDLFPDDFMFQLSPKEWKTMSSQFVMTSINKRPRIARPLAFTEHGVAMLANILKSKKARQTSVAIVRAFIALKQFSLTHKALTEKLRELENKYNKQFKDVYDALNYLLQKDKDDQEQSGRKKIGFKRTSED